MARKASSGEAVGVGVTITLMLALIYEMRPRDEQRAPLSTPAVAARGASARHKFLASKRRRPAAAVARLRLDSDVIYKHNIWMRSGH